MKKPNTSFYITIGLLAIAFSYGIISETILKKKGVLLTAKTTRWVMGAKTVSLQYQFYYKGKLITEDNVFNKIRGNQEFENRHFPVMYYPGWGGHSQLLIEPDNFKKYDLPFPDSLKWVLPYLK